MRSLSVVALTLLAGLPLAGCFARAGQSAGGAAVEPASTSYAEQKGVVYTPAGWPRAQTADLYLAKGRQPAPAVVTVHGGGWDSRDRADMRSLARKLASRGYVVLNIDYRLAPEFHHPAQLEDVQQAIRWLRQNAGRLGIDQDRIGAWGYSAGAHLAALAATDAGDATARLQAVVAGGTPSDLPHYPKSPIITRFIGTTYAADPQRWTAASPLAHVTAKAPPMFLYHGTWDRLVYVDDTTRFHEALQRAGVPAELYLIRGAGHIATYLFGFGAEGAGIDFLDRVLRPAQAP
jgi:acetyl esterase/lipase